jgi:hypothetical protein
MGDNYGNRKASWHWIHCYAGDDKDCEMLESLLPLVSSTADGCPQKGTHGCVTTVSSVTC